MDNMQDILKSYYANGGKQLFEQEQLDENVMINAALIVATLTSMFMKVPDVNPAKTDLQNIAQELLQKELRNPEVTPAFLNGPSATAVAFGVPEEDLSDLAQISNDFASKESYKSATTNNHTYEVSENLIVSATRVSREFVEMPDYYNTTCVIDSLYTQNGESQVATELVEFNHSHMGDWADMTHCDVNSLVKIVKAKMSSKEFIAVPNNTLSEDNETAEDIAFPFLTTMRQEDEWMQLEELVLKNIAMYGTTSPQTIGLIRNELKKIGSNVKINAITPSDDGTSLVYSIPDSQLPFRPGAYTDKERENALKQMFPSSGSSGFGAMFRNPKQS